MENDQLCFMGKILGEIYRTQKRIDTDLCPVSDACIYGLLNGFENVLTEHLNEIGFISSEKYDHVVNILDRYFDNPEDLKGFWDIESELKKEGVSRTEAIIIITYLKANSMFTNVIQKIESGHSPSECKYCDISEYQT